tara:strand:+ start:4046 stop:4786 length:741 start_codon:yes stop_codon:yes gene_type:complete
MAKIKKKSVLGLIVARKGSKGIKNKNLIRFNRKPLIKWTISEAKKSRLLDYILLSTDCRKIASLGRANKISVPFLRPSKLSGDKTKVADVIIHALNFLKKKGIVFEYVALLEPTSPLREAVDIDQSIKRIKRYKGKSLISVCRCKASHPSFQFKKIKKMIKPLNNKNLLSKSRQELEDIFYIDGSIYLSKVEHIFEKKAFYSDKTIFFEVPKWKSVEIDDKIDLLIAENLKKNTHLLKKHDRKIFN